MESIQSELFRAGRRVLGGLDDGSILNASSLRHSVKNSAPTFNDGVFNCEDLRRGFYLGTCVVTGRNQLSFVKLNDSQCFYEGG